MSDYQGVSSTREWFVIHHTDYGMETFTNDIRAELLASSPETATVDARSWHDTGTGPGSSERRYINWLTIAGNAASRNAVTMSRYLEASWMS